MCAVIGATISSVGARIRSVGAASATFVAARCCGAGLTTTFPTTTNDSHTITPTPYAA